MPGVDVNQVTKCHAAIYGKLPSHGDFLNLGMPRSFRDSWDRWCQNAISCSQQQLGTQWLRYYLVSPVWRFVFTAGGCGEQACTGIMIPSVDRVGRYFPLVLVEPLSSDFNPVALLREEAQSWYEAAENFLLAALEQDFTTEDLRARLSGLGAVSDRVRPHSAKPGTGVGQPHRQWGVALEPGGALEPGVMELFGALLTRQYRSSSLWWTKGSVSVPPVLMVSEALPSPGGYAAMLDGRWARWGWDVPKSVTWLESGGSPDTRDPARDLPRPGEGAATHLNQLMGGEDDTEPNFLKPARLAELATAQPSPARAEDRMRSRPWNSSAMTDRGKKRAINEDAYLDMPEKGIWVVADGMGGHRDGALASRTVVDALADVPTQQHLSEYVDALESRLRLANQTLVELRQSEQDIIGSTVAILVTHEYAALCLWAGDSRIYRLREGTLDRLTRDHTELAELLATGLVSEEDAESHPASHVLTRAVGAADELIVDMDVFDLMPKDRYLLCSDGLTKDLTDAEIASIMASPDSPDQWADQLVRLSLEREARDNITVIGVEVQ